jgi:hypothetical protein
MATVVVGGALANKVGSGGEAWVRMSWVRGLQQLGHDVWFVEQLADSDDPAAPATDWFRSNVAWFGHEQRSVLLAGDTSVAGPTLDELLSVAAGAVLVNISGHVDHPRLFGAFRRRVLVDIDPGFTQFWHADRNPGARVDGHDVCFTIGELIGTPGCHVPTSGVEWLPVRQPVVLGDWPVTMALRHDRFTTIGNWRGPYGSIEFGGQTFGLKVHEFRRFWDLPARAPGTFELALAIHDGDDADRHQLERRHWVVSDPVAASAGAERFRTYVQQSSAEFSVAQGVYVGTRCGWFSDRTVRYLASGRPALVQDTGFSDILPTGLGLVAFTTFDEAVAGAEDIVARYDEHAAAARQLAANWFAAERILPAFCEQSGIA